MPIYEYKCKKCNAVSEVLVLSNQEDLHCKTCGSADLVKLISAHNTVQSSPTHAGEAGGSCCGAPHSCGAPGSCCGK
ncbi:MAG: zinc ribbon domain-containing protein [Desulfobacteraceae bacterium]|nr:MAG: zinc ribbon domain-containing protein [Desulfobacteraceae bacterium]